MFYNMFSTNERIDVVNIWIKFNKINYCLSLRSQIVSLFFSVHHKATFHIISKLNFKKNTLKSSRSRKHVFTTLIFSYFSWCYYLCKTRKERQKVKLSFRLYSNAHSNLNLKAKTTFAGNSYNMPCVGWGQSFCILI